MSLASLGRANLPSISEARVFAAVGAVVRTRFGGNLRADLAKKHMAQLHNVKEAKEACAAPCAETMSDFTPKADINFTKVTHCSII